MSQSHNSFDARPMPAGSDDNADCPIPGAMSSEPISLADMSGHVERSEHQDVDVTVNAGCTRQSGVG